jgi:hypothetical protein
MGKFCAKENLELIEENYFLNLAEQNLCEIIFGTFLLELFFERDRANARFQDSESRNRINHCGTKKSSAAK